MPGISPGGPPTPPPPRLASGTHLGGEWPPCSGAAVQYDPSGRQAGPEAPRRALAEAPGGCALNPPQSPPRRPLPLATAGLRRGNGGGSCALPFSTGKEPRRPRHRSPRAPSRQGGGGRARPKADPASPPSPARPAFARGGGAHPPLHRGTEASSPARRSKRDPAGQPPPPHS